MIGNRQPLMLALRREFALHGLPDVLLLLGGMIVSPGEVRRRADVIVIVGELPEAHSSFLQELGETVPDLSASNARTFFVVADLFFFVAMSLETHL